MDWQPIETIPQGTKCVAMIAVDRPFPGYTTDPWCGWRNSDGTFARWPHDFEPTHWMPLPEPPK